MNNEIKMKKIGRVLSMLCALVDNEIKNIKMVEVVKNDSDDDATKIMGMYITPEKPSYDEIADMLDMIQFFIDTVAIDEIDEDEIDDDQMQLDLDDEMDTE